MVHNDGDSPYRDSKSLIQYINYGIHIGDGIQCGDSRHHTLLLYERLLESKEQEIQILQKYIERLERISRFADEKIYSIYS